MNENAQCKRFDGRTSPLDVRPMKGELDISGNSSGSARLQHGCSEVLVVINGPVEAPLKHLIGDRAYIDVSVQNCFQKEVLSPAYISVYDRNVVNNCMKDDNYALISNVLHKEQYVQGHLNQLLAKVIDIQQFPQAIIYIKCILKSIDGSTLSISFNACILALLNAGIPMVSNPLSGLGILYLAITIGTMSIHNNDNQNNQDNDNNLLMVDPTESESMTLQKNNCYSIIINTNNGEILGAIQESPCHSLGGACDFTQENLIENDKNHNQNHENNNQNNKNSNNNQNSNNNNIYNKISPLLTKLGFAAVKCIKEKFLRPLMEETLAPVKRTHGINIF